MRLFRHRRVLGILALATGVGVLLAMLMPVVGWIVFSAICLICAGIYLIKY